METKYLPSFQHTLVIHGLLMKVRTFTLESSIQATFAATCQRGCQELILRVFFKGQIRPIWHWIGIPLRNMAIHAWMVGWWRRFEKFSKFRPMLMMKADAHVSFLEVSNNFEMSKYKIWVQIKIIWRIPYFFLVQASFGGDDCGLFPSTPNR